MSTSATKGLARSFSVAARRRATPASSAERSASGTSIPGGGTGLVTGCPESWAMAAAASSKTQDRLFILPAIILLARGIVGQAIRLSKSWDVQSWRCGFLGLSWRVVPNSATERMPGNVHILLENIDAWK